MSQYNTPSDNPRCRECQGSGRVTVTVERPNPIDPKSHQIVREIVCPCCGGSGRAK